MNLPESVLQLEEVKVIQVNYHDINNNSNKLNLKLDTYIKKYKADETTYNVINKLEIQISNTDIKPFLEVRMEGKFSLNNFDNLTHDQIEYLIRSSRTTILFPYIRSYIFTLTSQSGNMPINIPIINVAKYLKHEEVKEDIL